MNTDHLIAQLEAASEGNVALDYDIYRAVNDYARQWLDNYPPGGLPQFTRSLDAAVTLVPEGYDYGFSYSKQHGLEAWVQRPFHQGECFQGYAPEGDNSDKTRAKALCMAALKAKFHVEPGHD